MKSTAMAVAVVILLLAGYGSWALWQDNTGSAGVMVATQQVKFASEAPAQPSAAPEAQGAMHDEHDEMARLCAEHMEEMRPMMDEMMGGMMGGGMNGDMTDGGGMMGR